MAAETVLVTGVHREELAFGDRVTAGLIRETRNGPDAAGIDLLRIPEGVSQRCPDISQQFYYEARQRELYLQLHQQVKGRYGLLIDLHSGFDEYRASADVYCHESALLDCVGSSLEGTRFAGCVRLIRIVAPGEPADPQAQRGRVAAGARTSIPPVIWEGGRPLYVGLEVYLPEDGNGVSDAVALARHLIDRIRSCGDRR